MTSAPENLNILENNTILKKMKRGTNILKITWIQRSNNLRKINSKIKNLLSKTMMMRK